MRRLLTIKSPIPKHFGIALSLLIVLASFIYIEQVAQSQSATPTPTSAPTPTNTPIPPTPTPTPVKFSARTYFIQNIASGADKEGGLLIIGTYDLGSNIFTSTRPTDMHIASNCSVNYSSKSPAVALYTGDAGGNYQFIPFAHWTPVYNSDGVLIGENYTMQPPPRNGLGTGAFMILVPKETTTAARIYIPASGLNIFGNRWDRNEITATTQCSNFEGLNFSSETITTSDQNWRTQRQSTETIAGWLTTIGDIWNVQLYDQQTVTAIGADFLNSMLGDEWPTILPGLRVAEGIDLSQPREYTQQCEGGGFDCYGATRQTQWESLGVQEASEESGIPVEIILLGIFLLFCVGIFYNYQTYMGAAGVRFSAMLMVFLMLPGGIALGMIPTNIGVVVMLMAVLVGLLRTFAQFRS